jgi:hypothetical protein
MERYNATAIWIIMLLLMVMLTSSACGGKEEEAQAPSQQVILEPGLSDKAPGKPAQPETNEPDVGSSMSAEEGFIDNERASTLNDLMSNKAKIKSYYFEYIINASYGEIFVRTWYANGLMKIVSAFTEGETITEYFDCGDLSLVYHNSNEDYGWIETFEPGDPNAPKNLLDNDYHQYRVVDTDNINGQTCRVLESRQGEKLWISTKHGFPLQVEYTDPTNDEHFIVAYEGLTFNQVN